MPSRRSPRRSRRRPAAAALKAENRELRAAASRGVRTAPRADGTEAFEVPLPLDVHAPGAARTVVAGLRGRVSDSVLQCAQLVVSELASNSVRHAGAAGGERMTVRVPLTDTMVRVAVDDPGRNGVIAPQAGDREDGRGFGLTVVVALSERCGLERAAACGTRVWAQLARTPRLGPASAATFAFADAAMLLIWSRPNCRPVEAEALRAIGAVGRVDRKTKSFPEARRAGRRASQTWPNARSSA
jgi:anti-sigma regulatory factor (Ser/Thr protein kinase)